jgi:hypothetical protein
MREAVTGNWYQQIPIPPEATWPTCGTCSTPARILDAENRECIRCRVERMKKARAGTRAVEMGT